jgi:hypothetical protein
MSSQPIWVVAVGVVVAADLDLSKLDFRRMDVQSLTAFAPVATGTHIVVEPWFRSDVDQAEIAKLLAMVIDKIDPAYE